MDIGAFWEYYRHNGWRWNVALTLAAGAIFIDRNLASDAAILRVPMIIGCGSGLVLLKEFPTEWPNGETEWFKTLIAVAAAAILLWGAVLVAHNAVEAWANGVSWVSADVWFILLALLLLLFVAAFMAVFLRWLASEIWQRYRGGTKLRSASNSVGDDGAAAAKWAQARRSAEEALEAAREAGRLEGNPPP